MIINKNKIQGLYLYGPDSGNIEFTKNDFVVSGDSIYVCDAERVSGIDPAEDTSYEYYHPYPGSMIISASEYLQYVKSGGQNKYVSSQAIKGILQSYQFGLDMEGVVVDYIDKNGDTSLILSSITDRPLDNLMLTKTLNRGMIKVSHELEQIADGVINGESFSTLFGFLEKKDPRSGKPIEYQLILSQYTYKQTANLYIRIQEMSSPLTGVSVYRYMSWSEGEFPEENGVISGWRNVFSYSSAIQSRLDALQQYYNTLAVQYAARVDSLRGSFRFREKYAGSTYESNHQKIIGSLGEGGYTVCLEGTVNGVIYSESVTVRLKDQMSAYQIGFSKLEGSLRLSSGTIELVCDGDITRFVSIYEREERS